MAKNKTPTPPASRLNSFFKIVFIVYVIFACITSSVVLDAVFKDYYTSAQITEIQTSKLIFFGTSTGLFILLLIAAFFKKIRWSFVLLTFGVTFIVALIYAYYYNYSILQKPYKPSAYCDLLY